MNPLNLAGEMLCIYVSSLSLNHCCATWTVHDQQTFPDNLWIWKSFLSVDLYSFTTSYGPIIIHLIEIMVLKY